MTWFYLVLSANFLYATVALLDKYILSQPRIAPRAYAFYVGLLGIAAFIFVPFVGFSLIPLRELILSLSAGAFFILGILFYYRALQEEEASRIAPSLGALIPILILILSWFFLREGLTSRELLAFSLLIAGSILISAHSEKGRLVLSAPFKVVLAAFLMALFFTAMRSVYLEVNFWDGFLWARLGGLAVALGILLPFASSRRKIKQFFRKDNLLAGKLFFVSKGLSSFGFLIFNYAIVLKTASLVNAFNGLQYAFIFVIAVLFTKFFPRIIKEEAGSREIWLQKISALAIIALGFMILFKVL